MSARMRALLIGMLGPALLVMGVGWVVVQHGIALGALRHIIFRDIVSGPAPLLILTGFVVMIVCTQVALEVMAASREEIETLPARQPARESEAGVERAEVLEL